MARNYGVLTKELKVNAAHTAMNGSMRLSSVFAVFQEIASLDASRIGYGTDFTSAKNYLWMIVKSCLKVHRMPKYLETVNVTTWTGKSGHGLFLRHYEITDTNGNSLIQSNATWVLVDSDTRVLVPEPGAEFENIITGREISVSKRIRLPEMNNSVDVYAKYSQIDINQHMNNTKYFDIAEDLIPLDYLLSHEVSEASVDYFNEIKPEECAHIKWSNMEDSWYFTGDSDKNCFSLKISFK